MTDIEERELPEEREGTECRTIGNKLVGMPIVYNTLSRQMFKNGKPYHEIICPGAFDLEGRQITFNYEHNDLSEYGVTGSNLRLTDRPNGVHFELDLPDHAIHLRQAAQNGLDMSFGFRCKKDRWEGNTRFVEKGELIHISAAPNGTGAYKQAYAELRSVKTYWKERNNLARKKLNMRNI